MNGLPTHAHVCQDQADWNLNGRFALPEIEKTLL